MVKRLIDILLASSAFAFLAPLLVIIAVAIKVDSRGPVLFAQLRVGRQFRLFRLYKFRTMVEDAPIRGPSITAAYDERITRVGAVLRRTKLDEIPQLFNVLRGDMSLVGPRPEMPRYVTMFRIEYEDLLRVRPGLTDPATLRFSDEEGLLASACDPEGEYVCRVLPEKIRLSRDYLREASILRDAQILLRTIVHIACSLLPKWIRT